MNSAVLEWARLAAQPTKTGVRRDLLDAPTATFANLEGHVTTLNPGEAPHPAHRHPDEELVVIKEGALEVTINGTSHQAGPGSVLFLASNDHHGWRNRGSTPATYYVFRFVTPALAAAAAK